MKIFMILGEYLVAIVIAILTIPLFLIGMIVGARAILRYMKIETM